MSHSGKTTNSRKSDITELPLFPGFPVPVLPCVSDVSASSDSSNSADARECSPVARRKLSAEIEKLISSAGIHPVPPLVIAEVTRIAIEEKCDALVVGTNADPIEGHNAYICRLQEIEKCEFDISTPPIFIEYSSLYTLVASCQVKEPLK